MFLCGIRSTLTFAKTIWDLAHPILWTDQRFKGRGSCVPGSPVHSLSPASQWGGVCSTIPAEEGQGQPTAWLPSHPPHSSWCPIFVTQTHIGAPRLHSPTFKSHGKVGKQGGEETKEPMFFLFKKFQLQCIFKIVYIIITKLKTALEDSLFSFFRNLI